MPFILHLLTEGSLPFLDLTETWSQAPPAAILSDDSALSYMFICLSQQMKPDGGASVLTPPCARPLLPTSITPLGLTLSGCTSLPVFLCLPAPTIVLE